MGGAETPLAEPFRSRAGDPRAGIGGVPAQARDDGGVIEMAMHKRRIKLEDGRYLIFYTFDEPAPEPPADAARKEPEPVPYNPESKGGED